MKRLALLIAFAIPRVAAADEDYIVEDPVAHIATTDDRIADPVATPAQLDAAAARAELDAGLANKLGFHLGGGELPINRGLDTTVLGLEAERPLFGELRGFADYSFVRVIEDGAPNTRLSPVMGDGDRLTAGVRHAIVGTTWEHVIRLAIDGEIGGGAQWTPDAWTNGATQPFGVAGLRLYWAILDENSPARIIESVIHIRAFAMGNGVGFEGSLGWSFGE